MNARRRTGTTTATRTPTKDVRFMREALAHAALANGHQSPNPMVGCVMVRGGKVIARGYHHKAGEAHAEVDALQKIGMRAKGATVYVTLEPCNHVGRVGKCTDALIAAGVARVVAAMRDPDARVSGQGFARLRAAGIKVESGVCEAEARALNRAYLSVKERGRPFVVLKAAISLDGRIATRTGDSKWISGAASRAIAHEMRNNADAILVGANTIKRDNPSLTTRLDDTRASRDPLRVLLDGRLTISPTARAVRGAIIITTAAAATPKKIVAFARAGAEVVTLAGKKGRVDLKALLRALAARGVLSLLVEGGGAVHAEFLRADVCDELVLFVAAKIIGADGAPVFALRGNAKIAAARQLALVGAQAVGDDIMLTLGPRKN